MSRLEREFIRDVVKLALLFTLLLVMCYGCGGKNPARVNATGDAITRAQVRGESAYVHVERAKPFTNGDGKVHLSTASDDLLQQQTDLSEAKTALAAERANYWRLNREFESFKARLFVRLGLFIQHIVWTIVGLWAVAGIVGALLPAGGWGSTILRAIPFANIFAWIRDRFVHPPSVVEVVRSRRRKAK